MAAIDSNIPVPAKAARAAAPRPMDPVSKDILDTLAQCAIGDSFVVSLDAKQAALRAGRVAARLTKTLGEGFTARVGLDADGKVRVWRVAYVAPKPRKAKAAVEA